MAGHANALIHEKSPYLLQHAHNPVDWLPWGEAALAKAVSLDKPIFLSIGYSTCHWCHVMERECFEDAETAALLNDVFVCIKVDREERPDLDSVYMLACQAMTGSGGWPLNILLTTRGWPFYAATYIPKLSGFGRMGLMEFAPTVRRIWTDKRQEVEDTARQVAESLAGAAGNVARAAKALPGAAESDEAYRQLSGHFDASRGGFGEAPKFPSPHNLLFLLRYFKRTGQQPALAMVESTLSSMRLGGVFDQVGLGFHRYSTDAFWRLPHFEKMLYDQAMLMLAYTEASLVADNPVFAQTAKEIATYVLRDLALPEGVFACGEDADSEGVEGKFYVWKSAEIKEILSPDAAALFLAAFNFKDEGNFEDEATGQKTGENIPYLTVDLARIASDLGVAPDELDERLDAALHAVFAVRQKRVRPHRDDKALTDWNGLAVAALARSGFALNDERLIGASRRAAEFLLSRLTVGPNGPIGSDGSDDAAGLLHRFRDGEAGIDGFFDDYAYLVFGLIELYQADFNPAWLAAAVRLTDASIKRFRDEAGGGFYLTAHGGEELFMRPKESQDGAMPSGNSVAMGNLLRLSRLTGREDYRALAEETGRAFGALVAAMPGGFTHMLCAVEDMLAPARQVTIAAHAPSGQTRAMLAALRRSYAPGLAVHLRTDASKEALAALAPYTAAQLPLEDTATAYVCSGETCVSMLHDPESLERLLQGEKG
ncbi:MAG: thioredoxin domain-containing protein [Desulfovibrionaceae bacterium]|nr:thioredoxin domain-containing protein [Desulfovibrionaceae bacterium]MBF0514993.1 thioredoxin domain-containing protein [Desulfovibrionaceae bacterium]